MNSISRRQILILAAYACAASMSSSTALAQQATSASGPPRIALDGHDPISYFDAGRPEKGSPQFSLRMPIATPAIV